MSRRADGGTVLVDGPVVAHWSDHTGPPPVPGTATLRGYLYGNAHGPAPDDPLLTTGTVQRVQVVTQDFRLDDRALVPVPGPLQLSDVQRSPRTFAHGDGGDTRMETGVLVEMAVRSTALARRTG